MSKSKSSVIVLVKGTSAYRKHLRSLVRAGVVNIRYHSNKAAGFPVVVGNHILHSGFESANAAMDWCHRKLGCVPGRVIGAKLVA